MEINARERLLLCGSCATVGVKGSRNINPAALTAITLLIAESDLAKKDKMVALVTQMLR